MNNDKSGGYGLVYQSVMRNKDISRGAKVLYAYLSSFAGASGKAFPSRTTICKELNLGVETYGKYKDELKEHGVLEVRQERSKKGTFQKNVFIINHL